MSNYGPHSALVEEVIQACRDDRILGRETQPLVLPAGMQWELIATLHDATRTMYDSFLDDEIDARSWINLKANENATALGALYDTGFPAETWSQIRLATYDSTVTVSMRVAEDLGSVEIFDEMPADMVACALARAVLGTSHTFSEMMFASYTAGYMPVGWRGAYPIGVLLLYAPYSNKNR